MVKIEPEMVAVFLVTTLMRASRNRLTVMRMRPSGNFSFADKKIQGHLPLARFWPLIAKDQHRQGLHGETPDHPERISLAERNNVSFAEHDRNYLQTHHEINQAVGCSVFPMGLAKGIGQDAIFRDAVQNTVRTYNGGVYGSREDQGSHQHDECMEEQL